MPAGSVCFIKIIAINNYHVVDSEPCKQQYNLATNTPCANYGTPLTVQG
jgi:hypothetical protein